MGKELSAKELKSVEAEMLRYLHTLCREHRIEYSVCSGTLLGAVRHKGFIPWDDDIDVALLRPEYERLMELLAHEDRYRLFRECDPGYYGSYAKLSDKRTTLVLDDFQQIEGLGVYIDIFPVDGMPSEEAARRRHIRRNRALWRRVIHAMPQRVYYQDDSRTKRLAKLVLRAPIVLYCRSRGMEHWCARLAESLKRYPIERDGVVGFGASEYGMREAMPASLYGRYCTLEFEGMEVQAVADWDAYLRRVYGDYMTPPPAEQRVSHHHFEAYWLAD